MNKQLLTHQVKYSKDYKDKAFVVHEGGTGKTVCACVWLKDGRDEYALVICPKRIVLKWKGELIKWETKATVVSKEDFKKMPVEKWSAIVVDEADEFASPLFSKGRSQLATALYTLVKKYPETPVMLCTATPIRSNPWNLHTLLCYLGIYIDKTKWRDHFFSLEMRPFLRRPAYFPKLDWRQRIRAVLEKYADIVLLKDCIDNVPPVTETIVKTPCGAFVAPLETEPTALFVAEHRWEQKNKVKAILEIAKEYRKVLVVAHYVEQVESLAQELSKDRETFMVHGGVDDQESILKKANEVDECFLVCQASLGSGFDANTFSCVVFASMSYAVRNYIQMTYRVRRIHDLHPVQMYYLLGGRCDKAVFENVKKGLDFIPSHWKYVA